MRTAGINAGYRYDLKTNNFYFLGYGAIEDRYKGVFLLYPRTYGQLNYFALNLFDYTNNRTIAISNLCRGWKRFGKYVPYVEVKSKEWTSDRKYKLLVYNIKTNKKKKIADNLLDCALGKAETGFLYYRNEKGYWKYNITSKKKTRVSSEEYKTAGTMFH